MSVFNRFAPFIQDYIYRNKWEELRPVQVRAAQAIFDTDKNVLLCSGTASGKTEAAFLPVLTHLWENPSASVGVLYISPLKALINDQFERLEGLLEEADIPVTKWHGDASAAAKKRVVKNPRGIIQTTPESLESMLMRNSSNAYRLFSDLRFVIIDELHYFMGDDRGTQLISLLERLGRLIDLCPRRIGLSATVGDTELAARWLCTGSSKGCVCPKGTDTQRSVKLSVRYFPIKQKIENSDSKVLLENYYSYLYESTCKKRCILFSNSKGEVEENIAHLRRISEKRGSERDALYLVHHANISAALREFTERRMKSSELPVCTGATVTLELGIDLGHLQRIVRTGCPLTVSSLVQQLGRTARRGGTAEMRFAFRHDVSLPPQEFYKEINWDFVVCIAMILLYTRDRFVEPLRVPKLPYSLLYHQTMSHLASQGGVQPKELARYILTLGAFRNISQEDYLCLLRYLLQNGQLERSEDGGIMIGENGEAAVSNYEFLAVFSVPDEYSVRSEAEEIGTVQSPFPEGAQFALAGQAWEVVSLDKKERRIYVKHINGISKNMWQDTGNEYVHNRVMQKLREVLSSDEEYAFLDDSARKRLAEIRSSCRRSTASAMGSVVKITDTQYAVFPFVGTRGSATLVLALRDMGFDAIVYQSRYIPVCIEVRTSRPAEQLYAALQRLKENGVDTGSLTIPDSCEISGKYNDFIPRELLKKQYAADYLDSDEMREMMVDEEPLLLKMRE